MTIERVVIAGGGTAGWMTAAALSRFLPPTHSIDLIESEEIGTVGVGEATIPPLADFNHMLGIDENEFLSETCGSFKLGIEFIDWGRLGDRYFHPFSAHGIDLNGVHFHHYWSRLRLNGDDRPLDDYAIGAHAARRARFIRPNLRDNDSPLAQIRHAYHLDAGRYAAFLRRYAERRGVRRREGRISRANRDATNGDIVDLTLEDGRSIAGDLFVDCSGFRALIIGKTLDAAIDDWQHWLPCDRAIALPSESTQNFAPRTSATAASAGWLWRIPLQHRVGNGHVYSSAHLSDDDALITLRKALDGTPLAEPNPLRFCTGRRREPWTHNCVAIGLSAGFLEPLESTSIHLIQEGISRLIALFPRTRIEPAERRQYNLLMGDLYEYIRDFIILHYHATERTDSIFWQDMQAMSIPDSLRERIELFRSNGRLFPDREDLFTVVNWTAVMTGQRILPAAYDPLVDTQSLSDLQDALQRLRTTYVDAAERMPPHAAFIQRFCPMRELGTQTIAR